MIFLLNLIKFELYLAVMTCSPNKITTLISST